MNTTLKPGDLIKDLGDGEIGLVLSLGPKRLDFTTDKDIRTVRVKWPNLSGPCELDICALENGWIELINKGEE